MSKNGSARRAHETAIEKEVWGYLDRFEELFKATPPSDEAKRRELIKCINDCKFVIRSEGGTLK